MDVLPNLLTEEAAVYIPLDLLTRLANCATDIILVEARDYIANPAASPEARNHVSSAFRNALSLYDGKSDLERREDVRKLADITYDDISPNVPLEKLELWRDQLNEILNDDNAAPFTAPRSGKVFEEVFTELQEMARSSIDFSIKIFVKTLTRNKKYFRDPPKKGFTGTAYKPILTNRTKYEMIVTGCNWLIEKKEQGKAPASWRFL